MYTYPASVSYSWTVEPLFILCSHSVHTLITHALCEALGQFNLCSPSVHPLFTHALHSRGVMAGDDPSPSLVSASLSGKAWCLFSRRRRVLLLKEREGASPAGKGGCFSRRRKVRLLQEEEGAFLQGRGKYERTHTVLHLHILITVFNPLTGT